MTDHDPVDAVRALVGAAGIAGRRLRTVVRLLTRRPYDLADLVRESGADRRTVESVLSALGPDLARVGDRQRIRPDRVDAYQRALTLEQLARTELADPLAGRLAAESALVRELDELIATAPGGRRALDHVSATAETVVRRALWLDGTFDLAGARLLCLGDHDLTSLALARVNPELSVMVVDIDERILEFVDGAARSAGLPVQCLYADVRFGLAHGARQWADLTLTDPPYTPDGVGLFLRRCLEGLRERDHARLVMAYGFGESHPGLGWHVQQAVAGLRLVYEAVLPAFNRYHGAQAVGGRSDLYVLRPTTRTWRTVQRSGRETATRIYTHGRQSRESTPGPLAESTMEAVLAAASGPDAGSQDGAARRLPVAAVVGDGWPREVPVGNRVGLATVLAGGLPRQLVGGQSAVAVDLTADPGSWLVRLLLAADAERLAVLLPDDHPDLATGAARRELARLFASRYRLRLRRATPQPGYALVEADRRDPTGLAPGEQVTRWLLDRPHGKVANTWREALTGTAYRPAGRPVTRNEARALVREHATRPELLHLPLRDLPRHQLSAVLAEAAAPVRD